MPVDAKVGDALKGNNVVALVLLAALVCAGACHGRKAGPAPSRSAAALGDALEPAFVARALRQIGGAHFHGAVRLSVGRADAAPIAVTTTTDAWIDRAGNYRFCEENDRDGGREVVLHGRELFVALRYGKMIRRVAEEPEPSRLLAEALGGPAAVLELVSPQARITPAGTDSVGGVPAVVFSLALADGVPAIRTAGSTWSGLRAWRGRVSIESLSGRMVVDEASGALVRADLTASFKAIGDAGPVQGSVDVHTILTDVASTPPIQPPAAEELVLRQRTLPEMHELLRGIGEPRSGAEPQRRAAAASHEARP
jgi:hypothetical protein